ncbi:hemicentin-1-like [Ptychodera flava]|uniref:hemicentin-1-like n=1 Tax=Ptychodera flava TaxID=63121 RepID=UPI00396A0B0D
MSLAKNHPDYGSVQIGPITVTTDPEKFKFELRDLYVQGGGDCPEMSVGAIEKALQISLPSSYIYVFTDARSKDYNVTKNVLKLIQEKQSQVVFVMTGDCGNRSHTGFKVYEQIAATSSGQLFMLNKSDVDEVLNFVRLSIQSRKVYLVNLNDESSGSKTHLLPVDPALREITVSVSGDNPSITLRDPMGNIVTKENGLMELLEINNGYIVSLKNPKPGLWSLTVESDSTHTVRVTGLSLLDFVPGYSRERVESTSLTRHRPIVGIPTHLILNATGLDIPGEFTKVELVDLKGQIIREFSLQVNLSNPSIYIVPKFLPPNEYFFVRVTGYDKQNFKFLRMTSAAVSPEVPTRPDVKMADHTSGYYGEVATITCHVDSLVPFTVQWTKNGQDIAPLLHFADTQAVTYNINDANEYSEGHYTCTAANSAGEGRATTFLDVTEPPPEIMAPQNVSVLPGGKAILTCIAFSSVQFNMTWTKPRSFVALSRHPRVTLLSNGSIEVRDATQGDGGKYRCTATNEGGATHRDIFLLIQEMPKVSVSARNITFKSGDVIVVSCSARGFPSPDLVWTKDGFPIDSSDRVEITEENDLRIVNAMAEDSGAYACIATNSAGTDAKHVHMSFIEGPRVVIAERYVLVKQRTTATLHCPTVGIPPPVITWYKNGFVVQDTDRTNVGPDGDLTIADVQDSDAGEYTCIARNDAGTDNGAVALSVGDEPSILQAPLDTRVDISMNVTMPCVSYGFPEPKTTWYKVNGSLETNSRVKISEDGSLFIRNLELEDEGTYVCVVSNKFGKKEFMAYLRITGLLHPLIALSTPYVNTNRGNTLTLTCEILIGNPPPTISWLKDNVPVDFNLINFMEQADDGSLVIKDVQLSDAGVYTCLASNIAGESKFDTKVSVNVPPTIGDSLDRYTAKQYTSVRLECLVEGKPRPSVLWEKDDQMISSNDPHFIISDSGSLLIPRVHARDRGVYKCLVSNTAGIASKNITLHVQVPPSVTDSGREISVTLGETVELPCKVDSLPPPTFSWKRNGVDISKNDIHYLLLGSGSLQITRARYEDSAIFTCVATNIVGNVTIDVPVKVNVPPVISPGPTDIVAVLGNPTIVPCESLGDPTPTVTWTRNGRDVNVLSEGYLLLESGSLQISSVLRADGGVYKCKVTNVAGSDEIYITLIVNEPPTIGNYVPDIIETLPHNIAVLPCPASGYPRPRVVWFKDDVELDTSPPDISIGGMAPCPLSIHLKKTVVDTPVLPQILLPISSTMALSFRFLNVKKITNIDQSDTTFQAAAHWA